MCEEAADGPPKLDDIMWGLGVAHGIIHTNLVVVID